jgi:hypothetical protein
MLISTHVETEEIETKDNSYETFAKEIMAKLPLDKVKAAGFDVDPAKVRGTQPKPLGSHAEGATSRRYSGRPP